jgi:hypothetical protein
MSAAEHPEAAGYAAAEAALTAALAQARAEGEAAGAARERERVLALVRAAYDALQEASFVGWFGPSAASSALDVLEQHIEAGAHVAPAPGGAR